MKYEDVPPLYRDTWATYDALRRLGFRDEQISHVASNVVMADGRVLDGEQIVVVLTADCRDVKFTIGPLDRPFEEARTLLEAVRLAIADGSLDDRTLLRLWDESPLGRIQVFEAMTLTVMQKGITIPVFQN
jgi:hypothetical protein